MTFSWRRRRGGRNARKDELLGGNNDLELTIPTHFRCPVSLDLMKDPVTLLTGITYDRESIERWIDAGNKTCPVTNQALEIFDLIPNHTLRKMIQDWCVQNRSHGIERIPTPRIPITASGVKEICSKIVDATKHRDVNKTRDLLGKMKRLARESERNKRCIVENGAGCAFSAAFESFATISMEENGDLLKDILSGLTWMFPFGKEGLSKLASTISLGCMTWFLKGEDLTAKQNTLMVLKQMLSLNPSYADGLVEIEGVAETLFKIVQVPICPAATKASLVVIYYIMSSTSSEKIVPKFADMGLVAILLEILVDGERSISEKALAVLDSICNCQEGKEDASNNALTIPIIVKKILRVSDAATEFGVSLLWKLCKHEDENLVVEALQVGAFQKLLVVLQVGCGQTTKEKATELLKLMNLYKDRVECFDSNSGFKYLKRSY